jgi:excisionase family DNA binding protein
LTEKVFLTINEVSEYLNLRRSTIYSMVEASEIPHYRVGRLIRFKQNDVDQWMEDHRKERVYTDKEAKRILRGKTRPRMDMNIDGIVKKAVDEVKGNKYNVPHGKPDQIKALRKEVKHGSL